MHEKQFWGRGPGGFHRIVYTEWGRASARPPIICVHGLVRNGRDFDCLSRALEHEGRQVFCPDIVGRGNSDRLANPAGYNYGQYLTDMTALIARTGADSVDWVDVSSSSSSSRLQFNPKSDLGSTDFGRLRTLEEGLAMDATRLATDGWRLRA